MTRAQIEAISAAVWAYVALQETIGANHYMDESETYNCGMWAATKLSRPIRDLANMVGIELPYGI